jgi:hypothetical protein
MPRYILPTTFGPRRLAFLIATCIALLATGPARADLVISAQQVTSDPGATGVSLDVTLTNTGPSSVGIGAFTFELTVGSTDITFTGVTTATAAPYIFDGLGLIGPDIAVPGFTGQDIMASDLFSVFGSGATLGAGVTVGLGHLVFDVSGNASGVYPILLAAFPGTTLSDFDGNDVPITSLANGSVTTVRSVPEPSAMLLLGVGGGLLFLRRHRGTAARRGAPAA